MKSATMIRVMCLLLGLGVIQAKPLEGNLEAIRVSRPPIGETIQQLTNQLINQNSTMQNITLDTRTPPRVKQQMKNHLKNHPIIENSHPGMAIPADESEFNLHFEESSKKASIVKLDSKPSTTEKGLSTWVLLNSPTVSPSTPKSTIKQIIKLTTKINEIKNETATPTESSVKPIKPFFKKRPTVTTTTKRPTSTTKMVMPVTKVKFSVLQSSKNKTQNSISNSIKTTLLPVSIVTTLSPSVITINSTGTNLTTIVTKSVQETSTTSLPSLSVEAKDVEDELPTPSPTENQKKNKKNQPKKKNKNRRRRPGGNKNVNGTEISDKIGLNNNSKPIGTQIYNYLSREVMPTVGVGLVGLMVTAGLASYFLYPFGPLRRSDEIDRKDVKGSYYYDNDYSISGVAEEDMISKVLAGMPENQGLDVLVEKESNSFAKNRKGEKNDKGNFRNQGERYKSYRDTIDAYVPQNSYVNYHDDKIQHQISQVSNSLYSNNKQFAVESMTNKVLDVTPAAVPEHGPRSLQRKKRNINDIDNDVQSIQENEILPLNENLKNRDTSTIASFTSQEIVLFPIVNNTHVTEKDLKNSTLTTENFSKAPPCSTTTENDIYKPFNSTSIMQVIRDLIEMKIKLGLELMKNTTMSMSRYFHEVQKKFESRRRRH